jgi:Cu/Ag efflux protein CusF
MKRYIVGIAVCTLSTMFAPASWAQSGGSMDMKDMDMSKCKEMKGSDMSQCMGMMGKDKAAVKSSQEKVHKGAGTITALDKAKSKVTIAHGPIPTLKWSSMTMAFGVKEKTLLDKLSADKKIEFEFVQEGADYIITTAK